MPVLLPPAPGGDGTKSIKNDGKIKIYTLILKPDEGVDVQYSEK